MFNQSQPQSQQIPIINTNILVDCKKQYVKYLCNLLSPIIIDELQTHYNTTKKQCEESQNTEVLKEFQQILRQIPKWNVEQIDELYDNVTSHEGCDILDDLIKAVFLVNIKILSSVSTNINTKRVKIEIPSTKRFVHKCMVEAARQIYLDPFLFTRDISAIERNRNAKEVNSIVNGAIEEAISLLLPIKDVLRQYLSSDKIDEDNIDQLNYINLQTPQSIPIPQLGGSSIQSNQGLDPPITSIGQLSQPQPQTQHQQPQTQQPQPLPLPQLPIQPINPQFDPTPSPPPLFPPARTLSTVRNSSPTPLMKQLLKSDNNEERERYDEDSNSQKMEIRPKSLFQTPSRSKSVSRSHTESPIKQFQVDPPRQRSHSTSETSKHDIVRSEQENIRNILLNQTRRDRTRNKYERYNNNSIDIVPNKYRSKSVIFSVEKEKRRKHSHSSSPSRSDDNDNREKERKYRNGRDVTEREESFIHFDRNKKNLFFDDDGSEDFDE
jgi:hypothetical protein